MSQVLVSDPEFSLEDGWHCTTASVTVNGTTDLLKFKVSEGPLAEGSNPFLAAMLFPSMKMGKPLHVSGTVSPKLLEGTKTIQEIWHKWFPEFQKIDVHAAAGLTNGTKEGSDVGVFFSGGVDSFYTLLKNQDEITKIIFVHGLDIKLANLSHRSKVSDKVRRIAREFGKPLIEVETNVHELAEHYGYLGSFLASIGLILSPQFKKIYFASTFPYDVLMPDSSHPLIDPHWGTETLSFNHDGCEASRFERVVRIAQSDIAMRSLRVCSKNPDDSYNCGKCEKCLRTMLALEALGSLERCTTFKDTIDIETVSRLEFSLPRRQLPYAEENLEALKKSGNHPELVEALQRSINRCRHEETAKYLYQNVSNDFLKSTQGSNFLNGKKNMILKSLWKTDSTWLFREVLKEKFKDLDERFLFGILQKLFIKNA